MFHEALTWSKLLTSHTQLLLDNTAYTKKQSTASADWEG